MVRWPTLVQNLLEGAYLSNTPNMSGLFKKDAGLKQLNRWLNFLYSETSLRKQGTLFTKRMDFRQYQQVSHDPSTEDLNNILF